MRDVLVVTSDTSISEETHGYSDATCSTLSYYAKDGNTSFTVGDASGDYYKVTYTETTFKVKADTAVAVTHLEDALRPNISDIDLTLGTEYSASGGSSSYKNLWYVTSTTFQKGEELDNGTQPTAMDSPTYTKE